MNEAFDTKSIIDRMNKCLDEMAEAKGVGRCALIYAMAQLIDALKQKVSEDEESYKKRIAELEANQEQYPESN